MSDELDQLQHEHREASAAHDRALAAVTKAQADFDADPAKFTPLGKAKADALTTQEYLARAERRLNEGMARQAAAAEQALRDERAALQMELHTVDSLADDLAAKLLPALRLMFEHEIAVGQHIEALKLKAHRLLEIDRKLEPQANHQARRYDAVDNLAATARRKANALLRAEQPLEDRPGPRGERNSKYHALAAVAPS
jgi:hypothetical protein